MNYALTFPIKSTAAKYGRLVERRRRLSSSRGRSAPSGTMPFMAEVPIGDNRILWHIRRRDGGIIDLAPKRRDIIVHRGKLCIAASAQRRRQ